MIIAAFDPGLATTGYAIAEGNNAIDYGVISTPANTPVGDRLITLEADVISLLEGYKIDAIAYEKPMFFGKNTNAALVQQGVGALLMAIARSGYSAPLAVTPSQVKLHATGRGDAPKSAIKPAVLDYFNLAHIPGTLDDARDALAVAIAAQALLKEVAA